LLQAGVRAWCEDEGAARITRAISHFILRWAEARWLAQGNESRELNARGTRVSVVMTRNATSGTETSRIRMRILPLILLFGLFFALCPRAAEPARQGGEGATGGGQERGEFVDPNVEQAVSLPHPSQAGQPAPPADFADPDAKEEPFVSRNSAPAAAVNGQAADVVSSRVLESLPDNAVVTTVEQAVNTSYEAEGEIVNVAEGETKGAAAPAPALPPVDEKAAYELVKSAVAAEAASGALAYFKNKKLTESSFAKALKEALERNLSIRFSEKNYEQSDAAITQAKAIKDPVFNVSLNGTQTDTYERREYIVRRRFIASNLEQQIQGVFSSAPPESQPSPEQQLQASNQGDTITIFPNVDALSTRGAMEVASNRSLLRTEQLTTTYLHQLPWGPAVSWTLSTIHNKIILEQSRSEDSVPIGGFPDPSDPTSAVFMQNDGHGNHVKRKRPLVVSPGTPDTAFYDTDARTAGFPQEAWTANFSINLSVPVPYSKNWGPNGPVEVPYKLAKVAQERAYWQLQSAINSTLLNVNNVYWGVVGSIRQLEVVTTNRKNLEQILKQTEDLLKLSRVTDYEISQAKTQVKSAQGAEESAWAAYVSASNRLKNLLNYDKDAVLLPVNYAGDLAGGITFQAADVLPLAMANNPDLRMAKADLDTAAISLKFAHNQVRPDLKINSGVSWSENAFPFGYGKFYSALNDLFRADTRNGFVSLNYRVPWGNRPAEDALNLAEEQYKQSGKSMSSLANTVSKNVNDAVAAVLSAREQAALALKNMQKAEEILKLVSDLWSQGRVPDTGAVKNSPTFTLMAKNSDLLSARLRYIQAQIGLKQAEGQLLAAQGIIAARYSEDLKITVKPVVEPGKKGAAKPQSEKKDTEKKEEKTPTTTSSVDGSNGEEGAGESGAGWAAAVRE